MRRLLTRLAALHLAARDPRVPLRAKLLAGLVVAYALSPLDLIPDFIPVLGLLDDLVLLPIGLRLAIRLVPGDVWAECMAAAERREADLPRSRKAAIVIVAIWLVAAAGAVLLVTRAR